MKSISAAWLSAADDDLTLIQEIIRNETLTHMVAFHAQQAIEKSFKALLEEREGIVPRIHTLETLLAKITRYAVIDTELDLLEDLDKRSFPWTRKATSPYMNPASRAMNGPMSKIVLIQLGFHMS